MCFIKIGDPLSPCEHAECKKALEVFKFSHCQHQTPGNVPPPQFLNAKPAHLSPPVYNIEISQEIIKKMKYDKEDNENGENLKKFMNSSFQPTKPTMGFIYPTVLQPQYNAYQNMYQKPAAAPTMPVYPNHHGTSTNEPLLTAQLIMNCNAVRHNQNSKEPDYSKMEMEKQIWGALLSQNSLLHEMREKTNFLTCSMQKIMQDFDELQKNFNSFVSEHNKNESKSEANQSSFANNASPKYCITSQEISSSEDLIQYLYGDKAQKFEYQLVQNTPFDLPLYRERNFSFSLTLRDFENKDIFHTNRIPLSIAIYSYENPPKCIDTNTSGQKIIKGSSEKDLINGLCVFDKIQIKEVTSHFRKGKVFIVVFPKMPTFGNIHENVVNSFVDYSLIKPLVIEGVVVKAKKLPSFIKKIKKRPKLERNSSKKEQIEKISIFEDS